MIITFFDIQLQLFLFYNAFDQGNHRRD